ncbi:unnamed protein product [Symbiodinium sp. CCMP2592]|nr:unnamed protein product [Symbiodinium sp. CCMP2592]
MTISDLPVRHLDSSATQFEQFADAIMHHPLEVTVTIFDNLYKFCCENKYSNLPEPFNLKKEPSEGYKFIREFGPKANNRNQFMEWTDKQINTRGGKIEAWSEGKVKEALHNHMRGKLNAKTIEHWPFTLKSFTPWFLDNVLSKMLLSLRQHAITWIGRTRTGKSLGSKTVLFTQSKYEIDLADSTDLVPSILTAKHVDFFKAEPLTRFKPGVFDDGMLQRMDASFLKAYSSAHFEQGAGRHACNNPYDRSVDKEAFANMNTTKCRHISHEDFIKLITPSFSAVDEAEDLDAILARTHFIVLSDSGV